jgi:hypothetical protein
MFHVHKPCIVHGPLIGANSFYYMSLAYVTHGQSELAFISALCEITFFYWQKIAKNSNYLNKKVENESLCHRLLPSAPTLSNDSFIT